MAGRHAPDDARAASASRSSGTWAGCTTRSAYFAHEPMHRRFHQDELTFAMLYEHRERFVNPLSHDEVVHGKRSLLEKMPGDEWQKLAQPPPRCSPISTRDPASSCSSWAPSSRRTTSGTTTRASTGISASNRRASGSGPLSQNARETLPHPPCLWRTDPDDTTFAWIDCADSDSSVVSYQRRDGDAAL